MRKKCRGPILSRGRWATVAGNPVEINNSRPTAASQHRLVAFAYHYFIGNLRIFQRDKIAAYSQSFLPGNHDRSV